MLSSPIESFWLQVIRNQYDLFMPPIRFSMRAKDFSIWDGLKVDMMVVFVVDASNTGIHSLGACDVVLADGVAVLSVDARCRRTKVCTYS